MRIRCLQRDLHRAISAAARVTSPRPPMPILSGVLLETAPDGTYLRVTATDLELAIRTTIPAEIERPGRAILPARLLAEISSRLPPATLCLDAEDGTASIACEKATFELATLPAEDFPRIPDPAAQERICSMLPPFLRAMIRKTAFAASKEDRQPILTGVHLAADNDTLELAATDGARLAVCRWPALLDRPANVTIPARAMNELARLIGTLDRGEVEIGLAEGQAVFCAENLQLFGRLLEGRFPDYHEVIPTKFAQRVRVSSSQLYCALQRVAATARKQATPVRLLAAGGTLRLTSSTPEVGCASEEIPASTEGNPTEVAFDPRLLLEALAAIDTEQAVLELTGPESPATIRPRAYDGDDNELHIIAPFIVS